MTIKEKLIARGEARPHRTIEIETKDGDILRFNLPYDGIERASYRRDREEFVKRQSTIPDPIWVEQKLVPVGGYPEGELGIFFDLHRLSDQKWSQRDVLEMFKANPVDIYALGNALATQALAMIGEDAEDYISQKKESSASSEQSSSTSEPA